MKYILFLLFFFGGLYSAEEKKEKIERDLELTAEEAKALSEASSRDPVPLVPMKMLYVCQQCINKTPKYATATFQYYIDHCAKHEKEHRRLIPARIAAKAKAYEMSFLCLDCSKEFREEKEYKEHLKENHSGDLELRKMMGLVYNTNKS